MFLILKYLLALVPMDDDGYLQWFVEAMISDSMPLLHYLHDHGLLDLEGDLLAQTLNDMLEHIDLVHAGVYDTVVSLIVFLLERNHKPLMLGSVLSKFLHRTLCRDVQYGHNSIALIHALSQYCW